MSYNYCILFFISISDNEILYYSSFFIELPNEGYYYLIGDLISIYIGFGNMSFSYSFLFSNAV